MATPSPWEGRLRKRTLDGSIVVGVGREKKNARKALRKTKKKKKTRLRKRSAPIAKDRKRKTVSQLHSKARGLAVFGSALQPSLMAH